MSLLSRTRIFTALILAAALSANGAPAADDTTATQLREVIVSGQGAAQRIRSLRFGAENLELKKLAEVPVLLGEADIVKAIALLPGVHSEGEGGGGFEVRGGTASQNLILLDGMTLYNPSHIMGIFSTFNEDAIGRATLYKGPVPSSFGGATSAVLETSMSAPDAEEYHASASVGLLAAKIKAEGPIVKDRLSFAATARRSYVDAFLKMVPQYRGTVMNFYDVTAKIRYQGTRGDILDVSFIRARDNMALKDLMGMKWGNTAASANWSTQAGERWHINTSAAVTDYTTDMSMSMLDTDSELTEYIRDFSVNGRAVCSLAEGKTIEVGLRSELIRVKSADIATPAGHQKEVRSGWQNALWANFEGALGSRFGISAGVRLSSFSALDGSRFHEFMAQAEPTPDFSARTYISPEPRASIKYNISQLHTLKAGAGVSTQNIHAIRSSATSFPFDRYALSSAGVKPESAVQYGVGYAGMSENAAFDWSAEVYYKTLRNVYDYLDGRTMFSQISLESIIAGGRGRSAGLELMLRKNSGRLTGWISYTLSKTMTRIAGINDDRWYKASNDRRNNIAVVAMYGLSERWKLSASWTFSSGQPLTAPDLKFELDGATCYYYTGRNTYSTPPSHRLDLAATYTRTGRRFTTQWAFGIYNAYCRYNPFVIYFEDDPDSPSGTRAVQRSLYGLIPSVSYSIKF